MKRLLPALALLVLLPLSACGGEDSAPTEPTDSESTSAAPEPEPEPEPEELAVPTDPICADLDLDALGEAAGLEDVKVRVDLGKGDELPPPFDGPPLKTPQCGLDSGNGRTLDFVVRTVFNKGDSLRRETNGRLRATESIGSLSCGKVASLDDVDGRTAVGYDCSIDINDVLVSGVVVEMTPKWSITCELAGTDVSGPEPAAQAREACTTLADSLDP